MIAVKIVKSQRNKTRKITIITIFLTLLTFQLCNRPSINDNIGNQTEQYAEVSDTEYSEMQKIALDLLKNQPLVILSTVNLYGYPEARTMGNMYPRLIEKQILKANSLDTYFIGNIHTDKVKHIRQNPKASVYVSDNTTFKAVILTGILTLVDDLKIKEAVWNDGLLSMYPGGPSDSNLCCLRFDARTLKVHRGAGSPTVLIKQ
ncbi:MAG TPA: pyridoxamine 5'-phosphate oxidase family protein [Candidatus Marinimicrobia bacterium]|nr:pyridoxamine 5'-phosphate oxidase family protein [Candidatus Neomarinimicrobiota bacterium]HRS52440.1 pyridoxamine 5'-phosphate oxidase family protein [Candidatus Neomarinimicrobiota bacterium]HRU93197.1 pyridoxamine 5'-phosphate oxidase family protein [Candidatus Neomarinimicrobiota bacterium]